MSSDLSIRRITPIDDDNQQVKSGLRYSALFVRAIQL